MAQKTPLPALTVNYADRWNPTWFADLATFRHKLVEDYHLRFLVLSYLRLKRYWLHLLSINQTGGFFFFQLVFLHSLPKAEYKSFLHPSKEKRELLKEYTLILKKEKHFSPLLKNLNFNIWKPRLSFKKQDLWFKLFILVCFRPGNQLNAFLLKPFGVGITNKLKKLNLKKSIKAYLFKKHPSLVLASLNDSLHFLFQEINRKPSWLSPVVAKSQKAVRQPSSTKLLNNSYLAMLPKFFNQFLSLSKQELWRQKAVKSKKLEVVRTVYRKKVFVRKRKFLLKKKAQNNQKRTYSTTSNLTQIKNLIPLNNVLYSNQLSKITTKHLKKKNFKTKVKNKFGQASLPLKYNFYKRRGLYQTASTVKSYLFKRIFAFKRFKSIKEGFDIFFKRFRHQSKLRNTVRRLNISAIFLNTAIRRVTRARSFLSYLPIHWNFKSYKFVGKMVVFERFGFKKYFVATFVVLHLAMSRGSATLVTDLLVRKLRRLHKHTQFLSCVEKICRYFLAYPNSNVAYSHSLCKGMEILFVGKLNGSDRAKVWRFKFGPMHTSTFYTNTREEHAKCMTKYGVFHIRVRMKLGVYSQSVDQSYKHLL